MEKRVRKRCAPAERQAQILDEAIRFLGERGYHGFTIQELAGRCSITNGTLLHYFESKEKLLIAVLAEYGRREGAYLEEFAHGMTREAKLSLSEARKFLRVVMARTAAQPELERLCLVLQSEAIGDPTHPAYVFFKNREKTITEGFTLMLKPYCEDATALAREIFAMMDGLTLRWLQAEQSFNLTEAWERVEKKLLSRPHTVKTPAANPK